MSEEIRELKRLLVVAGDNGFVVYEYSNHHFDYNQNRMFIAKTFEELKNVFEHYFVKSLLKDERFKNE